MSVSVCFVNGRMIVCDLFVLVDGSLIVRECPPWFRLPPLSCGERRAVSGPVTRVLGVFLPSSRNRAIFPVGAMTHTDWHSRPLTALALGSGTGSSF